MKVLLISNYKALAAKYAEHTETILARIQDLINHDRGLGNDSRLAYVDAMKLSSAPDVTDPKDPAQNKKAVDALISEYSPDYTVLLGAQDIIPYQQLQDPVAPLIPGTKNKLPSDLPYACSAGYSEDITDFVNPARKVTRLPDVYGPVSQNSPETFIKTLYYARENKSSGILLYQNWWNVCTTRRTNAMYAMEQRFRYAGITFNIGISPPCTDAWDTGEYTRMVHHHILHGAENNNCLYGESSDTPPCYPTAVSPRKEIGYIRNGMILLECACYGGQLYSASDEMSIPLANIYLAAGGIVLGSTAVTYSMSGGMSCMDYLVSRFMEELLSGHDTGTALLTARKDMLQKYNVSDAVTLKTLAEFNVFGYPSFCPVAVHTAADQTSTREETAEKQGVKTASCRALSEVPENIQKYIMHYLFTKGFRYAADNLPEIRGYAAPHPLSSGSGQTVPQSITSCYAVTAGQEPSDVRVFVFYCKDSSIINVLEYETNQNDLHSI